MVVMQLHLSRTANYDLISVVVLVDFNRTEFVNLKVTIILGFGAVGHQTLRCLTTLVEGTQSQLGTRLTDGLSGDDAHSLTFLNQLARRQVSAIAVGTHAALRLTSQHGTDLDALQRRFVDSLSNGFVDFLTAGHDEFTRLRMEHVVQSHTAEDTVI